MFCTSVVGLDAAEPRAQQKGHREQSPAAGLCSGEVEGWSVLAAVDQSLQRLKTDRPEGVRAGQRAQSVHVESLRHSDGRWGNGVGLAQ